MRDQRAYPHLSQEEQPDHNKVFDRPSLRGRRRRQDRF